MLHQSYTAVGDLYVGVSFLIVDFFYWVEYIKFPSWSQCCKSPYYVLWILDPQWDSCSALVWAYVVSRWFHWCCWLWYDIRLLLRILISMSAQIPFRTRCTCHTVLFNFQTVVCSQTVSSRTSAPGIHRDCLPVIEHRKCNRDLQCSASIYW